MADLVSQLTKQLEVKSVPVAEGAKGGRDSFWLPLPMNLADSTAVYATAARRHKSGRRTAAERIECAPGC
jgi:hypothetical protein